MNFHSSTDTLTDYSFSTIHPLLPCTKTKQTEYLYRSRANNTHNSVYPGQTAHGSSTWITRTLLRLQVVNDIITSLLVVHDGGQLTQVVGFPLIASQPQNQTGATEYCC